MDSLTLQEEAKTLTIKISTSSSQNALDTPSLNSPSPPSSAFVSALQSPYISPRVTDPPPTVTDTTTDTTTTPISLSSDDVPSTSYTPYDSADAAARVSFSFPVPRVSFTRGPAADTKLRSCDAYIGYNGQNLNLVRFCKWLKSELEIQGIASFVADRSKYSDTQSHDIADRIICSASVGVIIVTKSSVLNPFSVEEIRLFSQKKNLVPIFYDTNVSELTNEDKDMFENAIEANADNWRSCVTKTVSILQSKLGRKSIVEGERDSCFEFPFSRNKHFIGREKEISDIEAAFFGEAVELECPKPVNDGSSDGYADEESDIVRSVRKCKEPTLEAWIEGRGLQRQRSKHKKSRARTASVACLSGVSGIGKTELALEFAHRYAQRYKMVLWVGGEARYFRQNILNLSVNLGIDVSAESEKERGRIRSFEEQELDAFHRVKRELFRDVPYLLIIDNLENERDWWEGKDLHDLIPRNTGATHVIITTRLARVMAVEPIPILPLSVSDSLVLIRGKKRKELPVSETEVLRKIAERIGRVSVGLSLVGALLSELSISPSALLDTIERIDGAVSDFLTKILIFSFAVLDRSNTLAARMALAGAWFAPAPISSTMLATAASKLPSKSRTWGTYCCVAPTARRSEVESALAITKLGLAKRCTKQGCCYIQFHPTTQNFVKKRGGLHPAKAAVHAARKLAASTSIEHLWASAFLVFGFKTEPPQVQLKPDEMVAFIKKTAVPLAIRSFVTFSRCNSSLELLKVCTGVLEEVEKRFVTRVEGPGTRGRWRGRRGVDEYVWQDVTLVKAGLMETRAKLMMRGGSFDSGEELCRTCISIRTVMLGHGHAQTVAAQETLARLVRLRSKV